MFFVWKLKNVDQVCDLLNEDVLTKAGKLKIKLFSRILGCVRSNGRTCVKPVVKLIRNSENGEYVKEGVSYLSRVVVESGEGLREFVESRGVEMAVEVLKTGTESSACLSLLSQVARSGAQMYSILRSSHITPLLISRNLLEVEPPTVQSKCCNLIGNMCRHSDEFYEDLVGLLPSLIKLLISEGEKDTSGGSGVDRLRLTALGAEVGTALADAHGHVRLLLLLALIPECSRFVLTLPATLRFQNPEILNLRNRQRSLPHVTPLPPPLPLHPPPRSKPPLPRLQNPRQRRRSPRKLRQKRSSTES